MWRPGLHAHITLTLLNKSSPLDKAGFSSVLQSSLFVQTVHQTLHLFLSAAKHTPRTEQLMERLQNARSLSMFMSLDIQQVTSVLRESDLVS